MKRKNKGFTLDECSRDQKEETTTILEQSVKITVYPLLEEDLGHQCTNQIMMLQDVVRGPKGKKLRFSSWGTVVPKDSLPDSACFNYI